MHRSRPVVRNLIPPTVLRHGALSWKQVTIVAKGGRGLWSSDCSYGPVLCREHTERASCKQNCRRSRTLLKDEKGASPSREHKTDGDLSTGFQGVRITNRIMEWVHCFNVVITKVVDDNSTL